MLRVLQSPSAAERISAAVEFIRSFPPATEMLLVGSSRESVDDLVRGFAGSAGATFGRASELSYMLFWRQLLLMLLRNKRPRSLRFKGAFSARLTN